MSRARRLHRVLGLILVAPLGAWAVTGFLFFLKPGWDAAYAPLAVRTYPISDASAGPAGAGWLELRRMRTVLGEHLLVRESAGWVQLNLSGNGRRELPGGDELRRLVDDAIASNRERYGQIAALDAGDDATSASIKTTTGAVIELDWNRMQLQQSGRDTRRIDALYRVHYLQWTGLRTLDRVLGVAGIFLLVVLAALGVRIAFRR